MLVGSSLSQLAFGSSQGGGTKNFALAFTPTVGVFVVDRLALGAELNLGYSTSKTISGGETFKTKVLEYGIAPFARYYVLDAAKHKVFGQASYGVTGFRAESPSYRPTSGPDQRQISKSHYWAWSASLGYDYFITPNVALEVQPYYRHANNQLLASDQAGTWGISVGLQIFFPKTAAAAQ